MSVCIVYHYYESSPQYADNLKHFLQFGCQGSADVLVLLASEASFRLPQLPNVKYIPIENHNFDYGGHAQVVNTGWVGGYDHVFFINNSVRGPFLPAYCPTDWTDAFLRHFSNPQVGLVGASINVPPADSKYTTGYRARHGGSGLCPHVQSFAYVLSQTALIALYEAGFYTLQGDCTKDRLIVDYEIHLSQLLLSKGFKLACLMPEYNALNYAHLPAEANPNPAAHGGDAFFERAYFGRTPHPFETVFVKTNRKVYADYFLNAVAYGMYCNGLSGANNPGAPNLLGFGAETPHLLSQQAKADALPRAWHAFKKMLWEKVDPKPFRKPKVRKLEVD